MEHLVAIWVGVEGGEKGGRVLDEWLGDISFQKIFANGPVMIYRAVVIQIVLAYDDNDDDVGPRCQRSE